MSLVPSSRESESIPVPAASSVAATRDVALHKNGDILPNDPAAWFAGVIAKLWPERQRAKMLRYLTGTRSERSPRGWAAGENEPGASVVGALLRSEEGWRMLDAIMAGSRACWWRELYEDRIIASAYRRSREQIEQQLKLAFD